MALGSAQVKGKIKNLAKSNKADARILMRIYMMERFLERVANSKYKEDFIIKGGILVTSLVGVSMRSTMDIDTSIRNFNLSEEDALRVINEICDIKLDDGVTFVIKDISGIMDEMEYPGIRVGIDALLDGMVTPIKLDISTGDAITPRAIEYHYNLMLENRSICLWSYNLETIFAEKLQTVLARGILNTRMRDFYDIYTLLLRYKDEIDNDTLKQAFEATCSKRNSMNLKSDGTHIIETVSNDDTIKSLWESYRKKYSYATDIEFKTAIESVSKLYGYLK